MVRESFGELVRASRRKIGKSLQEVADALGVTAVYVSEVERGKRPPFVTDRLAKLSKVIEVDFETLVRTAWSEKKSIEFDPSSSDKQMEALFTLARGGLSEAQLDGILKIVRTKKSGNLFK